MWDVEFNLRRPIVRHRPLHPGVPMVPLGKNLLPPREGWRNIESITSHFFFRRPRAQSSAIWAIEATARETTSLTYVFTLPHNLSTALAIAANIFSPSLAPCRNVNHPAMIIAKDDAYSAGTTRNVAPKKPLTVFQACTWSQRPVTAHLMVLLNMLTLLRSRVMFRPDWSARAGTLAFPPQSPLYRRKTAQGVSVSGGP